MARDGRQLIHDTARFERPIQWWYRHWYSWLRTTFIWAARLVLMALLLTVVALSPLALSRLARFDASWGLLADVGQTYDAAAALLTALALLGIVGSLIVQVRDVHIARMQAHRESHLELVRMLMDDPVYQRAHGFPDSPPHLKDEVRQRVYNNLWMSFWSISFELGTISEGEVRDATSTIFNGEASRIYWKNARAVRARSAKGRQRRFVRIVDEEYREALAAGPPTIPANDPETILTPSPPLKYTNEKLAAMAIGAVGAAILIAAEMATGQILRRR
ncbi:DUF6082 family protein [Streptosporangium subroseum]|uniref:DUF6082 family protein n=1 Tax=Streptosporangium subroseum TaxID=106412 RepID=UPI003089927D|nr:DUF6082 family protein [Streptosporangium subroseum]